MIEKRVIGKKTFYVNIIENEDGVTTEQYFDDLIDILITEKNKELKERLKKEKEVFEEEKKKWEDAINKIDILITDSSFLSTCSEEEKDAYLYLANHRMVKSKKALDKFMDSYKWKFEINPELKRKKDEEERERKRLLEEKLDRRHKIKLALLVIGIVISIILTMVGCSMDPNF